jgi:esterase/lipase
MKKFAIAIVLLVGLYLIGPTPETPRYEASLPQIPTQAEALENYVSEKESKLNLKPDNEALIVWNDPQTKEKTEIAVVYLHGFSASREEGAPTHREFAKKYGCNLYLARLSDHGILTDDAMVDFTPDRVWESAKEAYAIGLSLGEEVILMSTSTGGTLALLLASEYDQIRGLINYSPNIEINDPNAFLLNDPWGLQIAQLVFGGKYRDLEKDDEYRRYWDDKYRLEAVVNLQELVETACTTERFSKIKEPVFNGVYYKNENEQDEVVKVSAVRKMHDELGTPPSQKRLVEFPEARAHVIANGQYSSASEDVLNATYSFAEEVLKMQSYASKLEIKTDSIPNE